MVTSGLSEFKYCVGGYPTPPRPRSEVAGTYKGVALISKHVSRAVPMDWSEVVWQSSRANVTATFVNNHWLTAGTIYGEPEGPLHPNFQAH